MSTADRLTLLRGVLTPAVMILWLSPAAEWRWVGLGIFIVAGITDFLDGRAARASNNATKLGGYLDPLADKFLVLGSGLALLFVHRAPIWWLAIVLLRELAITGLRSMLKPGIHMPASRLAKGKTVLQLFALGAASILHGLVPEALLVLSGALTVWTGWDYIHQHWRHIEP